MTNIPTEAATGPLRIGDFSVYQLRADDIFSYVVWDHHNGAHMTNAKGDQEFGLRGARDLAREYEFDAPAARPTYLGS